MFLSRQRQARLQYLALARKKFTLTLSTMLCGSDLLTAKRARGSRNTFNSMFLSRQRQARLQYLGLARKTFTPTLSTMLCGGDLLTAKRARGSQYTRSNSLRGKDRLEGLKPVAEEWHGKMCVLGVSLVAKLYSI